MSLYRALQRASSEALRPPNHHISRLVLPCAPNVVDSPTPAVTPLARTSSAPAAHGAAVTDLATASVAPASHSGSGLHPARGPPLSRATGRVA